MSEIDIVSGSALLKFIILAKNAKGKACALVIQQALKSPNTYVFGELLEQPTVKAVCAH